jgi:uncharacterized protein (DUF433 family)
MSKLTKAQVLEIRRRLEAGETQTAVAKDYPVSRQHISAIASGKHWAHQGNIEVLKRRQPAIGEDHGRSRLTEAQVLDIRQRVLAGESRQAIATDYGLSREHVWRIARGKIWKHLALAVTPTTAKRSKAKRLSDTQ